MLPQGNAFWKAQNMCRACDENIYGEERDRLLENIYAYISSLCSYKEERFLYEEHFPLITHGQSYAAVKRFDAVSVLTYSPKDEAISPESQGRVCSF